MNKTNYAYNIFSKLTFEKLPVGKVNINPYKDDNPYSPFSWTFSDTTLSELEVKESNGVKIVNLKTNNSKLFNTDNVLGQINTNFKTSSFQLEINISVPTFKTNNIFFNIASTGNIGFRFDIKKTRLEIVCNGKTIICNYNFTENVTYNIVISKIGATYFFIIDGMSIGKITSDDFNNNLNHSLQSLTIGASNSGYTNNLQEFNGNISNINIAYGNFIKYTTAFTKYGENLMSRYNFANYNINSASIYYCDVESVLDPKLTWTLDNPIDNTLDGYYKVNNNKFTSLIPNTFTMLFGLQNKVNVDDITLVDFGDYKIKYNFVAFGEPEQDVIVDVNTLSALNFENGIIDKIQNTTWKNSGSNAIVQNKNKLFGEYSFETKVIGDCLELTNPVNINANNPYSIDFYMLYKNGTKGSSRTDDAISIFSKNDGGDKYISLNDYRNIAWTLPHKKNNKKVRSNEITHYNLTFDGAVSRLFINDELDAIGAGTMSFNTNEPLRFGYHYVSGYPDWAFGTNGIWDNINIFQGAAYKVREYDVNADKLVIDLALDGENNSTKIVDNSYNILPYYNKNIVSLLYLKNNVNDEVGNNWIATNVVYGEGVLGCGAIIDGYISCADQGKNNPAWQMFYDPMGSLDFYIKRGDSTVNKTIFSYWSSDIRWKISISNTLLILDVYIGSQQTITFNIPDRKDDFELFSLIRHNNGVWELFVDGISCGKSVVYTGIVYAGIGASIIIDTNNGLHKLSMFRFIKNSDIYINNFTLPSEPYKYIKTNNWVVNGGAKLSTTEKFDGISSLNFINSTLGNDYIILNKNINLQNIDFTISFEFLLNTFINEYSSVLVASKLSNGASGSAITVAGSNDNRVLTVNFNGLTYDSSNVLRDLNPIELNKKYKVDILVKNSICYLYINGILKNSKAINTSIIEFTLGDGLVLGRGGTISSSNPPINVWTSSINGYIKNFKVYKGVAVEPISPIGKIQLDFNNDVIDKFNNSTWSNNGSSFNIENSVKGYCIYNQSGQNIRTNANNNLNFENKNFIINMDTKITSRQSASVLMMSGSSSDYQEFSFGRHDNGYALWCNNSSISASNGINASLGLYVNDTYYNNKAIRKNNVIHLLLNDVIVASRPLNSTTTYDFNNNASTTIGSSYNSLSQFTFNGYIDNFNSIKDYKEEINVNVPVLYLPLESNVNNIGYTPLTINKVGSPIFTTIDNKKCIKFESGKYLTINSDNIFKLGTSSDFYIEMDVNLISFLTYNMLLTNNNAWTTGAQSIWITNQGYICIQDYNGTFYKSTNAINLNSWYKIKIYRKDNVLTIEIDGKKDVFDTFDFNLSKNSLYIGCSGWATTTDRLNGYMCNLTMIVGTHIKDENLNYNKVIDLDFRPTNKSYIFKDNINKCIIHPVNITQRDYQDSKYCCNFNGTNQYIQLGKNDLLNFGNDDFVIEIIFKKEQNDSWSMLLCDNASSTNFLDIGSSNFLAVKMGGVIYDTPSNTIVDGVITKVLIQVYNSILTVKINGQQVTLDNELTRIVNDVNFNLNGNTFIGQYYNNSEYFKGTIYSIKVLRNTSDLSLLDSDEVVYEMHETFTLTNGNVDDDKVVNFDKALAHDVQLVSDNQSLKMILDNQEYVVPKSTNITNAVLFDGYKGDVKDLRVYDVPFSDKDVFMGSQVINTEYPDLMIYDDDYTMDLNILDIGDYVLRGFIEGYTDRKYRIYNKAQNYIVQEGIEDYEYNGINFDYFDEYEIHDVVNGQRYPLYKHEMVKGYIGGSVNLKNCGVKFVDMKVYCYRNDNSRLIGVYDLNEDGTYTIPNLDVNSFYDIVFKDQNRKIENISSSYRKPKAY